MGARKNPMPGERYRHFKGKQYQIITTAIHSETGEHLVIYQALYGDFQIYARPLAMFLEPVDKSKYPDAAQEWRFEPETAEGNSADEAGSSADWGRTDEPPAGSKNSSLPEKQALENQALENIAQPQAKKERTAMDDLMDFLDARTFRERREILMGMAKRLDETVIHNMAAAIEVSLDEGSLEEKYESLIQCVATRERFERER